MNTSTSRAASQHDVLTAILDPGAIHVGPPMLDLAWCLAVDLPHGARVGPLLEGYGRDAVDEGALESLMPHLLLRRLVDVHLSDDLHDAAWLRDALHRRAPSLLAVSGLAADRV